MSSFFHVRIFCFYICGQLTRLHPSRHGYLGRADSEEEAVLKASGGPARGAHESGSTVRAIGEGFSGRFLRNTVFRGTAQSTTSTTGRGYPGLCMPCRGSSLLDLFVSSCTGYLLGGYSKGGGGYPRCLGSYIRNVRHQDVRFVLPPCYE